MWLKKVQNLLDNVVFEQLLPYAMCHFEQLLIVKDVSVKILTCLGFKICTCQMLLKNASTTSRVFCTAWKMRWLLFLILRYDFFIQESMVLFMYVFTMLIWLQNDQRFKSQTCHTNSDLLNCFNLLNLKLYVPKPFPWNHKIQYLGLTLWGGKLRCHT